MSLFGTKGDSSQDLLKLRLVDQGGKPTSYMRKWFAEFWIQNLEFKVGGHLLSICFCFKKFDEGSKGSANEGLKHGGWKI